MIYQLEEQIENLLSLSEGEITTEIEALLENNSRPSPTGDRQEKSMR